MLVLVTTVYLVSSESSTLSALDERTASSTMRQFTKILDKIVKIYTPEAGSVAVFCEDSLEDRIQ